MDVTEIKLDAANPVFMDILTFWDFECPVGSGEFTDVVPWLPDDPIVRWCRENLTHPAQILVGLCDHRGDAARYCENFALHAVFQTVQDAVLFKLTWS